MRVASNFKDMTGLRFGKLLVIGRASSYVYRNGKMTRAKWLCRCDCGVEKEIVGASLRHKIKYIKSCGCVKGALPDGVAGRNKILIAYKSGAKLRGFVWELSDELFYALTSGDCYYCGDKPSTIARRRLRFESWYTYNGIDRVDSSVGYIPGNVVSCCKNCNRAKSNLSKEEFLTWAERVVNYFKSKDKHV